MRVLTLLTYYQPHWTGLTRIATTIAEGLARRGHDVTVLTVRHQPALAATAIENGVRVVRLRPVARVSRGMVAPGLPLTLARLLRTQDVVQVHTPMMEASLVARMCRLVGRPMLMTHQGDLTMPAGLGNQFIQQVGRSILRSAGHRATAVSTLSLDYARHSPLLRPLLPKLTAIEPPLDLPAPDRAAASAWRHELGLGSKPVVGFAGRFVEEKGFDFLLAALPRLIELQPDVHLVYAGDHDVTYERFYARCRPLLAAHPGRITMVGLLRDRQRLANFYALCDVFALPSRSECFGLVQVEAMASGTPVVATDIPGGRDPVLHTGMGLIVPSGEPLALAAGLAQVLDDPCRFANGQDAARELCNPRRSIDRYECLLASLVETAS